MRELKFRAYQNGVWLFSETSLNHDLSNFFGRLFGHAKIMQYTGFKDKNDKDIYEGDILTYQNKTGPNKVVEYSDKYGHFHCKFLKGGGFIDTLFYYIERDCEVIGNIHENKDLL